MRAIREDRVEGANPYNAEAIPTSEFEMKRIFYILTLLLSTLHGPVEGHHHHDHPREEHSEAHRIEKNDE